MLGISFVNQILIKYESKAKCESVLNEFKKEFTSELGSDISTYVLCFRIANVLVMLMVTASPQFTFRGYDSIIENNINEALE